MRCGSCRWRLSCNGWGTVRPCRKETICGTTLPTVRKGRLRSRSIRTETYGSTSGWDAAATSLPLPENSSAARIFLRRRNISRTRWAGISCQFQVPRPVKERVSEPAFQEVEQKMLVYDVLKGYLSERGIPSGVAARHCRQVSYRVHGKPYFAIGFQNVSGGWELRSRLFKGCIPPKDISLVSRQGTPTDTCDVFEGFFDFLSATTLGLTGGNDALVLNSVGNLERSFRYLDGYGKINCYLDNDEAGRKTFEALRTRYAEKTVDCSRGYADSKDLNEHLQKKLSEKVTNNKTLKFRL